MAGFEVTGVDIKPQPHYPYAFIQGDALQVPLDGHDFYWASPPCQAYALAGLSHRMNGREYPDLICGAMFGLRLVRHRWFELSGVPFALVPSCAHHHDPVTVCGHGTPNWIRERRDGKAFTQAEKRDAMGIQWMNRGELAQAIPPAYSEYIGKAAIALLTAAETTWGPFALNQGM